MTIDIKFSTVTNSIAALSISGVTIKDIDEIPETAERGTPVLFPRPNEFITDITPERVSFGGGGTALMNFSYTLHYVYAHARINSSSGAVLGIYAGLITKLTLIIEALLAADNITGAVDMQIESISNVGPVYDPAGNAYHGVEIALRVLEFAQ